MVKVVVAIGSNEHREHNITAALDAMSTAFDDLLPSPVYASVAFDATTDTTAPHFNSTTVEPATTYYNLVVELTTSLSLAEFKHWLQNLEQQQGRRRGEVAVALDLDVLLYDNWVGREGCQVIPHPDILDCAYVLRPLSDLLPTAVHPTAGKTYLQLWQEMPVALSLSPVDFIWQGQLISSVPFKPLY